MILLDHCNITALHRRRPDIRTSGAKKYRSVPPIVFYCLSGWDRKGRNTDVPPNQNGCRNLPEMYLHPNVQLTPRKACKHDTRSAGATANLFRFRIFAHTQLSPPCTTSAPKGSSGDSVAQKTRQRNLVDTNRSN